MRVVVSLLVVQLSVLTAVGCRDRFSGIPRVREDGGAAGVAVEAGARKGVDL